MNRRDFLKSALATVSVAALPVTLLATEGGDSGWRFNPDKITWERLPDPMSFCTLIRARYAHNGTAYYSSHVFDQKWIVEADETDVNLIKRDMIRALQRRVTAQ
jgi:hypothetical protein